MIKLPKFVAIDPEDPDCPSFGDTQEKAIESMNPALDAFQDGDVLYIYKLSEIRRLKKNPVWEKKAVS